MGHVIMLTPLLVCSQVKEYFHGADGVNKFKSGHGTWNSQSECFFKRSVATPKITGLQGKFPHSRISWVVF